MVFLIVSNRYTQDNGNANKIHSCSFPLFHYHLELQMWKKLALLLVQAFPNNFRIFTAFCVFFLFLINSRINFSLFVSFFNRLLSFWRCVFFCSFFWHFPRWFLPFLSIFVFFCQFLSFSSIFVDFCFFVYFGLFIILMLYPTILYGLFHLSFGRSSLVFFTFFTPFQHFCLEIRIYSSRSSYSTSNFLTLHLPLFSEL